MSETAIPPRPAHPCQNCGEDEWWWHPPVVFLGKYLCAGNWLCGVCRPNPETTEIEQLGEFVHIIRKKEA